MIVNKRKVQDDAKGLQTSHSDPKYQGSPHKMPKTISFYDQPPHDVIGITEFQSIAVSRLQVLKKIQNLYDQNKEGMWE